MSKQGRDSDFAVPKGLTELLNEFTMAVLRTYPENLVKFAKEYFTEKYENSHEDDEVHDLPAELPPAYKNINRRKSVAAERYDPSKDKNVSTPVYPKTSDQNKRLSKSVHSIFLFKSLDTEQLNKVIDAMQEIRCDDGEVIIKDGDEEAEFFYVVESGTYEINVNGVVVHTYVDEGSFGELALMYNTPRAATVTSRSSGTLWALDRGTFRRIVLRSAFMKRQTYEEFINSVSILSSLEPYERMKVCDALKSVTFQKDDVIVKRGDKAENMYFVEKGEVRVMRANESGQVKEVSRIGRGGYFGELGLISKNPRAADVIATGKTVCAALDVEAFERLLGPCVEVMKRNMKSYEVDMSRAFTEQAV